MGRTLRRVFRSDFVVVQATDGERARLEPRGIASPAAQDYAAWRRAVLIVAAALTVAASFLALREYRSAEEILVQSAWETHVALGGQADFESVRQEARAVFGSRNLRLLEANMMLEIAALIVGAGLALLAAALWARIAWSRRAARLAWLVLFGVPLVNLAFPWAKVMDFGHLHAAQAEAIRTTMALSAMLAVVVNVWPKVLALFPGILRSSMAVKTLVHESALPGHVATVCAPLYAVFLVVVFSAINQFKGDWKLLAGLGCLIVGALMYVIRRRAITRPHTKEEAGTTIRSVRRSAALFNVAGIVFLSDALELEALAIATFFTNAAGGLLLMMVVTSDYLLVLIAREHVESRRFHGSKLAGDFDRKLEGLAVILGKTD